MKFYHVLESALSNTQLKRVRMKTDPRDRTNPGISSAYEGYIIEEEEGIVRIMVMNPDPSQGVMELPLDQLEPSGNTFSMFKQFIIKYILDHKGIECDGATHYNIANASDIQHLEAFLKELGIEREEFEKMSRLYLMS